MKFEIEDPVITVEVNGFNREPDAWITTFWRAQVMIGGVCVMRREYPDWEVEHDLGVRVVHEESDARDYVLEEFGNKLRVFLDEPDIPDPWRA